MNPKISIIGCGWLGFPLAKTLISHGFTIKGSTTSKHRLKTLNEASIEGYMIQLNGTSIIGNYNDFLAGSDTVIINIPPGLRKNPNKNHVAEIRYLISAIEAQNIKNVLYISSTSVFKDEVHFPVIANDTVPNGTSIVAKQLVEIETIIKGHPKLNTTILRFGGLFDAHRHPGRYLSGKENILNPLAPVNLIHKADCINIILNIVQQNYWNYTFNAVYPQHPQKKEYYENYCKTYGLELPKYNLEQKSTGKIIDSSELVQLLNYNFEHGL